MARDIGEMGLLALKLLVQIDKVGVLDGDYRRAAAELASAYKAAKASRATGFAVDALRVGLKADDLGKVFTVRGKKYKVTGLNLNAYKFPVEVERQPDGKWFKMSSSIVVQALAARCE